jgi:hypothetical protein
VTKSKRLNASRHREAEPAPGAVNISGNEDPADNLDRETKMQLNPGIGTVLFGIST